jgi:hypothetical protein
MLWFLILTLLVPIFHPTIANARDIDTSDNKFPVLISVNLDKQNYQEGETGLVTIIIRDDKNELATWPYIWFGVPSGSPGSVSGDFVNGGRGLIDTQITDTYVQQTFSFTFTIPAWAGNYYGYNIQGITDKNKNQAGYDLRACSNNNIYRTTQVASFPNIVPICNTNFTVTLLTPEQKAATKAAAELKAKQEAEAKAAAELKAKQDAEAKAAAELKAKQDAEATAELKIKQEAELKAAAELKAKKDAEEAAAKVAAELKAKQEGAAKTAVLKKTTIVCVKGKLSKKITAIKPKCPTGYKLKK